MTAPSSGTSSPSSLPAGMTVADIQQAFKNVGYGDLDPKNENEQFVEDCLAWLDHWFERFTTDELKGRMPFAFIFDSKKITKHVLPNGEKRPALRNAKELAVCGHVYATALSLRDAYAQPANFSSIPEALSFIASQGWDHLTAVIVSPESRLVLVHIAGADLEDAFPISFGPFKNDDFSIDKLDDVLSEFYSDFVATHDGDCDVWAKATDRKLKDRAERQIQASLHGFLRHGVLPKSARVDKEIQTYKGREDVRILQAKPDRTLETAIMELKVLRPTDSPDSLSWAKAGVDQVKDYFQTDKSARIGYVCCYDARKADEAMPDGVAYATSKDVRWRRYFLTTPGCGRLIAGYDS